MCNRGLTIKCNQCDRKSKDKEKYSFQTINVVWDIKLKKKKPNKHKKQKETL